MAKKRVNINAVVSFGVTFSVAFGVAFSVAVAGDLLLNVFKLAACKFQIQALIKI